MKCPQIIDCRRKLQLTTLMKFDKCICPSILIVGSHLAEDIHLSIITRLNVQHNDHAVCLKGERPLCFPAQGGQWSGGFPHATYEARNQYLGLPKQVIF